MLSKNQLSVVCMLGCGDSRECRYLRDEPHISGVYNCCKLRPNEKKKIDLKVEEYIRNAKKKGKNPYEDAVPLGDNCPGQLILKHIETGLPD
ncbi:MAG: hypothetical protein ACW99G_03060 [Candidatus Thorarchaeota archaeon]|jgi:hypothetical protein